MKKIFIAAPLFTPAEREYNLKIEAICTSVGFKTFLAQRDVGIVKCESLQDVFCHDMKNLEKADLLVANLDGIDVDSGTAWEIGYAYANKKPIIGLREDVRMYRDFLPVNLMIFKSCLTITTLEHLNEKLLNY